MSFRAKVFKREPSEFWKKRRTVRRVNQEEIHRLGSVGIRMSLFASWLYFSTLKKLELTLGWYSNKSCGQGPRHNQIFSLAQKYPLIIIIILKHIDRQFK